MVLKIQADSYTSCNNIRGYLINSQLILQKDNSKNIQPMSLKKTTVFILKKKKASWKVMIWPTNSPDLNMIKFVWNYMKRQKDLYRPASTEDLLLILQDIWNNFPSVEMPSLSKKNTIKQCCQLIFGLTVGVFLLHFLFGSNNPKIPNERDSEDVPNTYHYPATTELPPVICTENISVYSMPTFNGETQNFKDFLVYRHCRAFPLLLDSPMKCGGPHNEDVFLLLAIKTAPGNFERREAIRRTWGEEKTYNGAKVKRVFLSGVPRNKEQTKRMMQLLSTESEIFEDIVQWNFEDSFYNLTLKQVLFHHWLEQKCPGAQFIFNGDDDVFVHTLNVVTYLQSTEIKGMKRHLFVGALNEGMPLIREKHSKYYVSKEIFPADSYDPYCGGGGILMSSFTASSIQKESQYIPLIPIDDAYLGMCLKRAGLAPQNHEGIRTLGIRVPNNIDSFDPCFYQHMLMVHRFMPYEMLIMWKSLQITKLSCLSQSKTVLNVTKFN
ncbi:N-acetyllactosaminide beta-1,3-N-acetylglucosaminyltransferase 3-like isoform X1 [Phyllobates terribilis]|uniref:N-acetyllactosaminide beta-1,3-N-acetylglucosaminyltransferase 3-like isoform X1 n=2 Tax=Phyllobates terribilis TaxID=111132 RepID=UPI003CCAE1C3